MDESLLRNLLREWITGEYTVDEICAFEDEVDALGQPIPHSEAYRAIIENRLARLLELGPSRVPADVLDWHQSILTALAAVSVEQNLYYWFAHNSLRSYSGVVCRSGVISFTDVSASAGG